MHARNAKCRVVTFCQFCVFLSLAGCMAPRGYQDFVNSKTCTEAEQDKQCADRDAECEREYGRVIAPPKLTVRVFAGKESPFSDLQPDSETKKDPRWDAQTTEEWTLDHYQK